MESKDSVRFEMARIAIWPVVRISSVVFLIIGLVVGVLAFLVFPHPSSVGLTFSTRLLSAALFSVLYTVIVTLGLAIIAVLYNFLTARMKWGIVVHLSKSGSEFKN